MDCFAVSPYTEVRTFQKQSIFGQPCIYFSIYFLAVFLPHIFTADGDNDSNYRSSDGCEMCRYWRLNMKSDVVIQQLSVRVSSADRSYMPQQIVISVGSDLTDLHEIKDVRIPRYRTQLALFVCFCTTYHLL